MESLDKLVTERGLEDRAKFDRLGDQIMIMENYMENYVPVQMETMIVENMRLILTED